MFISNPPKCVTLHPDPSAEERRSRELLSPSLQRERAGAPVTLHRGKDVPPASVAFPAAGLHRLADTKRCGVSVSNDEI